jgi:hypothetical protein
MVILLIVQYVFGMWTNLYATIPAADRHTSLLTATGKALANPPAELAAHAGTGVLLLLLALWLLIRAAIARNWFFLAVSIVGLGCITGAALNGASFVSTNANVHSLVMAMLWAGALLVFVIALFVLAPGASTG